MDVMFQILNRMKQFKFIGNNKKYNEKMNYIGDDIKNHLKIGLASPILFVIFIA